MKYIDLVDQFWRLNKIEAFTSDGAYLYFYLLDQWNDCMNINPIPLRTLALASALKMDKRVVYRARNELQARGLIGYKEGLKRKYVPEYTIIENVDVMKSVSCITQREEQEPRKDEVGDDKEKDGKREKVDSDVKTRGEKEKVKIEKREISKKPKQGMLFAGNELQDEKGKREKRKFEPPNIKDVEGYFECKNIKNWKEKADAFFFHYDSIGWHTSVGAKIYRWDSLANKWMLKDSEDGRDKSDKGFSQGDSYKRELEKRFDDAERKWRASNGTG